jgi:hypothetical protein
MLTLLIAPWQVAMPLFILFLLVVVLIVNSSIRRRKRNKALMDIYKDNEKDGSTDSKNT